MNGQLIEKLNRLTLLVVDDNEKHLQNSVSSLKIFFKNIYSASTYSDALQYIEKRPDIALLDIELDEKSGIELAQKLEKKSPDTAVIFVSGFSEKRYLMSAIKLRVIDYIIKPATLSLLMNSFEKALDKIGSDFFDDIYLDETLIFNQSTQTLYKNTIEVPLGAKERQLLKLFVEQKGRVLSKGEISDYVWSYKEMSDSALKNLLLGLRKKIGKGKIKNVPGAGWTLFIEGFCEKRT